MPHEHKTVLCNYHNADHALVAKAIDGALAAKLDWENTPFNDRAAIFLKAADLASTKYRCVKQKNMLLLNGQRNQVGISWEKFVTNRKKREGDADAFVIPQQTNMRCRE